MKLSQQGRRLVALLKEKGLNSNPWPPDYTFDDFAMSRPVDDRAWMWPVIEELSSCGLIECRLMGSEWCKLRDVHIREWNDKWYIHWTTEGLLAIKEMVAESS